MVDKGKIEHWKTHKVTNALHKWKSKITLMRKLIISQPPLLTMPWQKQTPNQEARREWCRRCEKKGTEKKSAIIHGVSILYQWQVRDDRVLGKQILQRRTRTSPWPAIRPAGCGMPGSTRYYRCVLGLNRRRRSSWIHMCLRDGRRLCWRSKHAIHRVDTWRGPTIQCA